MEKATRLKNSPYWCNSSKAVKMAVTFFDDQHRLLIIANNAVMVIITPVGIKADAGWYVDWGFAYEGMHRITFSSDELRAAFGFTNDPVSLAGLIGDSAEDGKYIRHGQWLNIPSVPANYENNVAVSIEINEQMQKCIKSLMAS